MNDVESPSSLMMSNMERGACAMSGGRAVYLGTDGGATTSKVGAVWGDGSTVSTRLLQRPTNAGEGPEAVVRSWVDALTEYLAQNGLSWADIQGAGLAIPGPFQRYGVLDRSANLPPIFEGFDVHTTYSNALAERAGRPVPLTVGNDGDLGGVAEAQLVRGNDTGTVVMLAPGSGLGCAYIGRDGLPLQGDTLAGMEAGHMPAPLHELGVAPYPVCLTCWLIDCRAIPITSWPVRPCAPRSGRWPCAAWRRRATRWRARFSTFRRGRLACTWQIWQWPWIRNSW
jgi:hypothetical protein